jgi:predicted nucleotidyltransferase
MAHTNSCSLLELKINDMRLTPDQIQVIKTTIQATAALQEPPLHVCAIRLYGSRVDDSRRGGDIDLALELSEPVLRPAYLRAQLASQIERQLEKQVGGSPKVDLLLQAPNLAMLPIHEVAQREGVLL